MHSGNGHEESRILTKLFNSIINIGIRLCFSAETFSFSDHNLYFLIEKFLDFLIQLTELENLGQTLVAHWQWV